MSLAVSARAGPGASVATTGFSLGAHYGDRRRRHRLPARWTARLASVPAPAKPRLAALTARETEVLVLVRERLTNAEIADRLFVSVRTVETHVSALLRKLGASDRRALARGSAPDRPTVDRRGALPIPLTTFVGRTVERAELVAAFRDHRLVTATGPGGVGKTRLALAAAADVADDVPDGVVFVDLVKVTQPDAVVDAIATAAAVPETSTTTRAEALVGALGPRTCLLVVDNREHVQDAARTWIERLLDDCPSLRVLATSRLRLMLPFEHVVSVPGLSLGTPEGASDAEALFVERMIAAGAAPPQPADLAAIGAICAALDGMALGIELAAGAGAQPRGDRPGRSARLPAPPARRRPAGAGTSPLAPRRDRLELRPAGSRPARRAACGVGVRRPAGPRRGQRRERPPAGSGRRRARRSRRLEPRGARARTTRPLPGAGDDPPVRRRARGRDRGTSRGPRRLVPTTPRRPVGTGAGRRAVVRRGGRHARRCPRRAGVGAPPLRVT